MPSFDIPNLAHQPRVQLGVWPTPLQYLPRLSEELRGPRIWVKRDDLSGLATGGNKTRKLEYLLGAALAAGVERVVTFGAVQSNHARQTAAACAQLGLTCHLLLRRQVDYANPRYESGANVLLDHLFKAEIEIFDVDDQERFVTRRQAFLDMPDTLIIPAGGSNAVGSLGYVNAALELSEQANASDIELNYVIHASSSAATQAGLMAGFAALQMPTEVLGINVFHDDPAALTERVDALGQQTLAHLDLSCSIPAARVNHAYIGEGYGIPESSAIEAIRLAASLEGLLFDPVYSGKALAAVIDQINLGNFADAKDVVLIHTGGTQALNVYESEFINP